MKTLGAWKDEEVLMNDVLDSTEVEFRCITSTILWTKFMFERAQVCVLEVYGPAKFYNEERLKAEVLE